MSKPPRQRTIQQTIASAAAGAETNAASLDKVKELEERLDAVELLIEQAGLNNKLVTEVSEYVAEKKAELNKLQFIRWGVIGLSILFLFLMFGTLLCILFYHKLWYLLLGPYDRGVMVVSFVAGCVVILSLLLKGAFRSIHEVESADVMPEALKIVVEAAKNVIPKS